MTKITLNLIMFILLLYACNKTNNIENIAISPNEFIPKKIKISDFSEDLSYIFLSDNIPIAWIYSIQYFDNKYILGIKPQQLVVFDNQGNYLHSIGKMGRGPGEYQYAFNFALNDKDKEIYILDKNKILVFSIDGNYKRDIDISSFEGSFDAIGYKESNIYLFENIKFGQAKFNWLIINIKGEKIFLKTNNIPKFKTHSTELINVMFKSNNHYCYWNSLNDTIFDVFANEYKSRYQFLDDSYRITLENIGDRNLYSNKIFIPRRFWESKQFLFFNYYMESKSGFGLFDKSNQKFFSLEQKKNPSGGKGYINDLDGGVNFKPLEFLYINNHEYLVGWTDTYKLKTYLKSEAFQSSTPKYPEKKKELERQANSLDENDNPVLMLVKLKN